MLSPLDRSVLVRYMEKVAQSSPYSNFSLGGGGTHRNVTTPTHQTSSARGAPSRPSAAPQSTWSKIMANPTAKKWAPRAGWAGAGVLASGAMYGGYRAIRGNKNQQYPPHMMQGNPYAR